MKRVDELRTADRAFAHDLMVRAQHDDAARERYVLGLKREIARDLGPGNRTVYERRAKQAFHRTKGRTPETLSEVRGVMQREGVHQMWSALSRSAQEMMWESVQTTIGRDLARLESTARRLRQRNRKLGSLMLDPMVRMPAYVGKIDIHLQPGGYELDEGGDDILAGALYERGGGLYSRGVGIGGHDSKAGALLAVIAERYPDFEPKRIIDLGCSAGGATVSYAEAFPGAKVYGIDIGAGMLRYAHARAESIGLAVHFEQMNACKTRFAEGDFDLVVSHNLFHEVSATEARAILRECHRLLSPGGVVAHLDVPARGGDMSLFERFIADYQTLYNAEPCWRAYLDMDHRAELIRAGFAGTNVFALKQAKMDGPGAWWVFGARK